MISMKVFSLFFTICLVSVESSPLMIDVLENRDIIFPRRSELVKRTASNDVSELNQQKVSLASFIENIETGIIHTALNVDPLATDTHAEVLENTTTAHPIERRSTNEDADTPVESSTAYVLLQTTEKVPAVESVPSHVVIDRVSVFKAPEVGAALFPSFVVQDTNVSSETETKANDDQDETGSTPSDSSESEQSTESSESSESSNEESSKVKGSSTTTEDSQSSSSTSPSSTTPLPVEAKKIAEEELKEKIGEIEAEPVIFTARV